MRKKNDRIASRDPSRYACCGVRMDEIATKSDIEAMPSHQWAVQCRGAAPGRALNTLPDLLVEIVQATGMRVGALKLIDITPDLDGRVRHWQRQLSLPENGITVLTESEGFVMGKQFVWRHPAGNHCAVMVVSNLLLDHIEANTIYGTALLAHELGHIDDECWRDPDPVARPRLTDWPGLRAFVAEAMWSEAAANTAARPFISDQLFTEDLESWRSMLAGRRDRLKAAHAQYQSDADVGALWFEAHAHVCTMLIHLGRMIGEAAFNEARATMLTSDTRKISGAWADLIADLMDEIEVLLDVASGGGPCPKGWSLGTLEPLVNDAFVIEGMEPVQLDSGRLHVGVHARA
jgi:hypothetical protein